MLQGVYLAYMTKTKHKLDDVFRSRLPITSTQMQERQGERAFVAGSVLSVHDQNKEQARRRIS